MLSIELRFPTGKWHATPWGRQVNEGAVEWPPAPWRFLRALLAVWHHKFPEVPESDMRELLAALAGPPIYRLPSLSQGHTRHYMPVANNEKTKIFDTFVVVSKDDPVILGWPDVSLTAVQQSLLNKLLASLSYFGRAESWVVATLGDWDGTQPHAEPLSEQGIARHQELVRLLALGDPQEFSAWRSEVIEEKKSRKLNEKRAKAVEKGKPPEKEKLSPKEVSEIEGQIPVDLFHALHAETNDLRKAGWNRPPGSRWVDYVRNTQLPEGGHTSTARDRHSRPTVARYAVVSAVRPRLTDALFIGERVRTALIKISDGAALFVGRNTSSQANELARGHQHAHFLAESNRDPQGRITHITIFAPAGFSRTDEQALSQFRKTWGNDGHELQYVLLGIGHPTDFGGVAEKKGESPILAASRSWVSRTPFVPADRLRRKYNLTDPAERRRCQLDLARMIRKEISRREWLTEHSKQLQLVEAVLDPQEAGTYLGGTLTSWLRFRRERALGAGQRGNSMGFGLRLTFAEEVRGPIVLGYGAHFGLGQFIPVIDR